MISVLSNLGGRNGWRYFSNLFRFLYSDGVQFLAALKILLKVERLLNPERIATSVMERFGSIKSFSAWAMRFWVRYS